MPKSRSRPHPLEDGEPLTVNPVSVERGRFAFSVWDLLAAVLLLGVVALLAAGSQGVFGSLKELAAAPISLDPRHLPGYAARTTLRMLVALVLSLLFTFGYATLAAKSRRAEQVLMPLLDILQSVPILGFVSVTVIWFLALAPGKVLGAELVAIFAIFTSQVWNMTYSLYGSLRTVPRELIEVADSFRMSRWMRFWRLEVPFAVPPLVWNTMMSMSGGWFFVVASEAILVGDTEVALPGIGSYIEMALKRSDLTAVLWAIVTMLIVIVLYDQLLFRPLVAWSDRFRFDRQSASAAKPRSWMLDLLGRSAAVNAVAGRLGALMRRSFGPRRGAPPRLAPPPRPTDRKRLRSRRVLVDVVWYALLVGLTGVVGYYLYQYVGSALSLGEGLNTLKLGFYTLIRVFSLTALASVIWVPVGVMIGLDARLTERVQPVVQFLAAFPANLLFPLAVWVIVRYGLNTEIWLSPLMILGAQWYILFNVIAGASAIPNDLRDVGANLRVRGWLWWRRIALPAVFPSFITGAITASGGAWNASIVAEVIVWGDEKLEATGLGAYIVNATEAGDYPRIILGVAIMSLYVVLLNRAFWRPLYERAARRYRVG
ncbi:MAG: ABC transporter permease subunit [Trueperaceae bacterium]|nr:ABC transporter permease subunit [Truepera sp.]HRQ11186.1 ABC transporter permease subunit [Trueperaceae bacterium]